MGLDGIGLDWIKEIASCDIVCHISLFKFNFDLKIRKEWWNALKEQITYFTPRSQNFPLHYKKNIYFKQKKHQLRVILFHIFYLLFSCQKKTKYFTVLRWYSFKLLMKLRNYFFTNEKIHQRSKKKYSDQKRFALDQLVALVCLKTYFHFDASLLVNGMSRIFTKVFLIFFKSNVH